MYKITQILIVFMTLFLFQQNVYADAEIATKGRRVVDLGRQLVDQLSTKESKEVKSSDSWENKIIISIFGNEEGVRCVIENDKHRYEGSFEYSKLEDLTSAIILYLKSFSVDLMMNKYFDQQFQTEENE